MSYNAGQILHAADLAPGQLVASWKATPSLTGITTETDVINVSWTPPVVGCYRVRGKIPYDAGATPLYAKMILYVAGSNIDFTVVPAPDGAFVGLARFEETYDVTSVSAITLRMTVNRATSTNTLNSRLSEARLEVYKAGDTGIRA